MGCESYRLRKEFEASRTYANTIELRYKLLNEFDNRFYANVGSNSFWDEYFSDYRPSTINELHLLIEDEWSEKYKRANGFVQKCELVRTWDAFLKQQTPNEPLMVEVYVKRYDVTYRPQLMSELHKLLQKDCITQWESTTDLSGKCALIQGWDKVFASSEVRSSLEAEAFSKTYAESYLPSLINELESELKDELKRMSMHLASEKAFETFLIALERFYKKLILISPITDIARFQADLYRLVYEEKRKFESLFKFLGVDERNALNDYMERFVSVKFYVPTDKTRRAILTLLRKKELSKLIEKNDWESIKELPFVGRHSIQAAYNSELNKNIMERYYAPGSIDKEGAHQILELCTNGWIHLTDVLPLTAPLEKTLEAQLFESLIQNCERECITDLKLLDNLSLETILTLIKEDFVRLPKTLNALAIKIEDVKQLGDEESGEVRILELILAKMYRCEAFKDKSELRWLNCRIPPLFTTDSDRYWFVVKALFGHELYAAELKKKFLKGEISVLSPEEIIHRYPEEEQISEIDKSQLEYAWDAIILNKPPSSEDLNKWVEANFGFEKDDSILFWERLFALKKEFFLDRKRFKGELLFKAHHGNFRGLLHCASKYYDGDLKDLRITDVEEGWQNEPLIAYFVWKRNAYELKVLIEALHDIYKKDEKRFNDVIDKKDKHGTTPIELAIEKRDLGKLKAFFAYLEGLEADSQEKVKAFFNKHSFPEGKVYVDSVFNSQERK